MAKTKTIEKLFPLLAQYSDLIPILVFLLFRPKLSHEKGVRILVIYLVFDFLINFALEQGWIPFEYHNRAYPIFTFIETILFSWFFIQVIKSKIAQKRVWYATIITSIASLIYYWLIYFVYRKKMPLDSVPIAIETVLIFIFVGLYFYEQMNNNDTMFIYDRPHFWGVLGIMIYLAGSFFVYLSGALISVKELQKYWFITNIASIIKNLLFVLFFYLQANQKKKKAPGTYHQLYPQN